MPELFPARLSQLRTQIVVFAAVAGMLGTSAHLRSPHASTVETVVVAAALQLFFASVLVVAFRFTARFWAPVLVVCAVRAAILEVLAQVSFPVVLLSWLGMVLTVVVTASVVLALDETWAARRAALAAKAQLRDLVAHPPPNVVDKRLAGLQAWLMSAPADQADQLAAAFRTYSHDAATPAYVPTPDFPAPTSTRPLLGSPALPPMLWASLSLGVVAADVATGSVSVLSAAALALGCVLVAWQLQVPAAQRWMLSTLCVALLATATPFLAAPDLGWIFLGPAVSAVAAFSCLYWLQGWYARTAAAARDRADALWVVRSWRARHTPRARRELASFVHTHLVPRLLAAAQDPARFSHLRGDAVRLLDEALRGRVTVSFEDTCKVWSGLMEVSVEVDDSCRAVLDSQPLLEAAVEDAFAELLANAYRHANAHSVHVRVHPHVPRLMMQCQVLRFRSRPDLPWEEVRVPPVSPGKGLSALVGLGATVHEVTVERVGLSWLVPDQVLGRWTPAG